MVGLEIDFDVLVDLCRNEHRRIAIAVLADQRRSLTLDDLTKAVVKHNHHVALTEVSDGTLPRIKTALHHVHVPKLDAAGFVEYDLERQLVEPTAAFDRAEPQLSAILDADPQLEPPVEL